MHQHKHTVALAHLSDGFDLDPYPGLHTYPQVPVNLFYWPGVTTYVHTPRHKAQRRVTESCLLAHVHAHSHRSWQTDRQIHRHCASRHSTRSESDSWTWQHLVGRFILCALIDYSRVSRLKASIVHVFTGVGKSNPPYKAQLSRRASIPLGANSFVVDKREIREQWSSFLR